jgi:hypothetical protein
VKGERYGGSNDATEPATPAEPTALERAALLCRHLDRELAAIAEADLTAVPLVVAWFVSQIARAAYRDGETNPAPFLAFIRRVWRQVIEEEEAMNRLPN